MLSGVELSADCRYTTPALEVDRGRLRVLTTSQGWVGTLAQTEVNYDIIIIA